MARYSDTDLPQPVLFIGGVRSTEDYRSIRLSRAGTVVMTVLSQTNFVYTKFSECRHMAAEAERVLSAQSLPLNLRKGAQLIVRHRAPVGRRFDVKTTAGTLHFERTSTAWELFRVGTARVWPNTAAAFDIGLRPDAMEWLRKKATDQFWTIPTE